MYKYKNNYTGIRLIIYFSQIINCSMVMFKAYNVINEIFQVLFVTVQYIKTYAKTINISEGVWGSSLEYF